MKTIRTEGLVLLLVLGGVVVFFGMMRNAIRERGILPAVAAEHAAMMAKEIVTLKGGDFIVTNDDEVVLVIRDVAGGYVQLKEKLWMPASLGEMSTSVMAERTKQVIPYGHRDWPKAAHKFLAP